MSQSNGEATPLDPSQQIAMMGDEIGRLRALCLKLLNEHNDGQGGQRLSQVQSDEIKNALRSAWAELERKQSYLEGAVAQVTEFEALKTSLQDAWAEIERKQGYLETAFADAQVLQNELEELRASM